MRKLLLGALLLVVVLGQASAQEALKNANEALKTKDYGAAIENYQKYFAEDKALLNTDMTSVYNLGYALYKGGKYADAITYFDKSIENDYKADVSSFQKALSYRKLKDNDNYKATLEAAITAYPDSKYLPNMKKALSKEFSKKALVDYNKGNALVGSAPAEPKEYIAHMEKAIAEYDKAEVMFQKALDVNPDDAIAKRAIESIDGHKEALATYRKAVNK